MTREQFDDLVKSVESGIGQRPAALRRRVFSMAVLGYLMLAGLFSAVLVIGGGFVAVSFWADLQGKIICGFAGALVLIGGSTAVLKAILVQLPPPKGIPLNETEAPALFALLRELSRLIQAPVVDHVLLIPQHNAAIVQVPRLGVLGWSRNYLLIGLPLLEGHSTAELRAILAHELAHLSRQHGRFSHWIYRLRRSWETLFAQLQNPRVRREASLRPLIAKCLGAFWPRFNAHAFVFSRANEFEADALAARLAGRDHLRDSFLRMAIQSRILDEQFWPAVWDNANEQAQPPPGTFLKLRAAIRAEIGVADSACWIGEALRLPTTNADTHPCLAERLRALGVDPQSTREARLPRIEPSAADALLGAELPNLRNCLDQFWQKEVQENWKARHAKAAALNERLVALDQAVPLDSSDTDALWDRAHALMDLKGDKDAEPLLREILVRQPKHVAANFHLGRILLDRGAEEGCQYVEKSVVEEPTLEPQACVVLREHFRRSGRPDQVRKTEARLDRYEAQLAQSRAERCEVTPSDTLIPHELSESELGAVRIGLAQEPELAEAWLARKQLRFFPQQKLFVLCAARKRPWYSFSETAADRKLIMRLSNQVQLPGRTLVFTPNGDYRALARKVRQVPDSAVFTSS
jgi:Zn-dependent protease with chaperone function